MDIYDLTEKIDTLSKRGYHVHYIVHVHYIIHTSNQEVEQLVEVHLKNLNTENEYVGTLSYLTLNDMYQSIYEWLYTHEEIDTTIMNGGKPLE